MRFEPLELPDVVLVTPEVFGDDRGFFLETYREREFQAACGPWSFVQDNHSRSRYGVLRGLHYQLQRPQGKLVRVTRGAVFDVAVDLRAASQTFGEWVGRHLSEDNQQMLWVPPGFAHGFVVTSEMADLQYKCTDYYAPGDEHCIRWDDPALGVDWPVEEQALIISEKDRAGGRLSESPWYRAMQ